MAAYLERTPLRHQNGTYVKNIVEVTAILQLKRKHDVERYQMAWPKAEQDSSDERIRFRIYNCPIIGGQLEMQVKCFQF
ncbi:hypothetical protein KIN20_018744 [Parelaphostrongylus tenuis]|uniref:Uncharacterized protein n=1 Tax=Parelaphostrongylus tenuis TaxID=148309 RepID=A0AAD5N1G4_PARTN|nr:hypothetical protein KIN20_018744 [Parelaphostrongylus tenuis]